jgi:hypothetical protein
MKASADTIKEFSRSKFKADPFILSALHTWTQNLSMHIHDHSLVSAEMYDKLENRWRSAKDFLFPVRALAKVFQGKVMGMLQKSLTENRESHRLVLKPSEFETCIEDWLSFASTLPRRWAVYISKPRKCHDSVVKYFAAYVNRSAITNSRIASFDGDDVKIIPKRRSSLEPPDQKTAAKEKKSDLIVLSCDEFVRRFTQHFPPKYFHRIRTYGLASGSSKTGKELKAKRLERNAKKPNPPKLQATCEQCQTRDLWLIIVRINRYTQAKHVTRNPIWEDTA